MSPEEEKRIIDEALAPFEARNRAIDAGIGCLLCKTCGQAAGATMQSDGACACGCRQWQAS